MKKTTKITMSLFMMIIVLTSCSVSNQEGEKEMNEEKEAIDFELLDLSGNAHSLLDYEGKKVYIKFWATWCPICLSGLDKLNTLSSGETDFVVLTIVSPGVNGEKKSEEFIEWFEGLDYSNVTVLLDEEGLVTDQYGVRGYPTSAYLTSEHKLVNVLAGHVENNQVKELFEGIK